ncbi:hypothetical protein C6N75_05505 [Streptomyces solincola]|uniref:Uncharacterized protein n=1 Tax=Streptomyces solincola TaxID=2100817 RepID=A0A2S9Q0G3_9ACTN|nr:hypothetical protein [Streptomyces solincola]PRH80170.1 hypothetical protein C6N75_05505 [Streptomyces solincola]
MGHGYGHPGPYGQQPPPRKGRGGTVALLVIGGLVVLGALGYGVKSIADGVGGVSSSGAFPKAEYKLTVPKSLLDGEYTLLQDLSGTEGAALTGKTSADTRADGAAIGQYTAQGEQGGKVIVLSGFHGQVKKPHLERGSVLRGAATAENATVAKPAEDVTPTGSDTAIECAVLSAEGADGSPVLFPMCAWGDANTVAGVAFMDTAATDAQAGDFDLAEAAERTVAIRAEVRTPIG